MKKNLLLCWIHIFIFAGVFLVLSLLWPKWLAELTAEGLDIYSPHTFNKIYPAFHWLQQNSIAVLCIVFLFTADLLICSRLQSNKARVIWTAVLFAIAILGAGIATVVFRSIVFG